MVALPKPLMHYSHMNTTSPRSARPAGRLTVAGYLAILTLTLAALALVTRHLGMDLVHLGLLAATLITTLATMEKASAIRAKRAVASLT